MANILSWGKPTIKIAPITNNVIGEWVTLSTPVENSTKLTPTKGAKMEAKIEGGANEAVKYKRNTYALEFEIRQMDDRVKPLADLDGVIDGEYAVRIIPENVAAIGKEIHRANVSCEDSWDSENGAKWKYTFDVLEPTDGTEQISDLKLLTLSTNELYFGSAVDSTGKTVTVTAETTASTIASAIASETWLTVTKSNKVATIKTNAANTTGSVRTAIVTITIDGRSNTVKVYQISE